MVAPRIDPEESFLDSVEAVLLPLELSFRKLTKHAEHCFNGVSKYGKEDQFDLKNKVVGRHIVSSDNRTKSKGPFKILVGIFEDKNVSNARSSAIVCDNGLQFGVKSSNKGLKRSYGSDTGVKEEVNSLHLDVALSLFINGFIQALPRPFKSEKKLVQKMRNGDSFGGKDSHVKLSNKSRAVRDAIKEKDMPFEYLIGFVIDQLYHLPKFEGNECRITEQQKVSADNGNPFGQFRTLFSLLEEKRVDLNGFLGNLKFARVGGLPASAVGVSAAEDLIDEGIGNEVVSRGKSGGILPHKLANGLLSMPMSKVELLRSTLSSISLTGLIQLLPQMRQPSSKEDHPNKKKLCSVQDFFKYTEAEGKRFFQELDRDEDGRVTLEDLEVAMSKRKLPKKYAHEFLRRARSHLFSKSFGWKQFLSLVEQKEPTILRAYTGICLSESGMLQKSEILAFLEDAGLPANEDNAVAMMRFLNADSDESISYGHFRNFMLLLPSEQLQEDPRSIWFESATVVAVPPVPPPVETPAGSVLKSALAGGLSCSFSCFLMHPIDTVKTQVQASTLSFPEILAKLPQIGTRGLYKGSIPAILGQFSGHGLRMGIFEVSKALLMNVAPTVPELQVQSIASFCSTFLGTAMRIPSEVLKQRLQAGLFDGLGEAIVGTWRQDGLPGFFRGTGVTLLREVPFYVAGTGLYEEAKKASQRLLGRELEPWETIAVGAVSGGLTAVLTTPFDVIKTRMMTALPGHPVTFWPIAISILRQEGPLGLYKGAVPRFFWVFPLGAINFAGYELIRKAMDGNLGRGEPLVKK